MLKKFTDFTNEKKSEDEVKAAKVCPNCNIKLVYGVLDYGCPLCKKTEHELIEESKETVITENKEPVLKDPKDPVVDEPLVKEPVVKEPVVKEPKNLIKENFEFIGKIVKSKNQKPSKSILLLEVNNISKEKLHYIISKQSDNSLVILKYNEKVEMKLTEFVNTIISYYKKNEKLKTSFDKIVVEGTDQFSIIKNIPNIKFGERQLIEVLNDDLIKLLK